MKNFLWLLLIFSIPLFGETKSTKLSDSSSVKKSERQAIIVLPQLGMENYKYKFDVTFCPAQKKNKKAKCKSERSWIGTFKKSDINEIISKNISQLVSKKYDVISFEDSKVTITTATKKDNFKINPTLKFNFQRGSKDEFENYLKKYLNNISKVMQKILNKSAYSRKEEMNNIDEVSFVRTQGKSKSLTVSEAEWLKNSGFAFALYFGKLYGSVKITENKISLPTGDSKKIYLTDIEFNDNLTLFVYKYTNGKFIKYSEISVKEEKEKDLIATILSKVNLGAGINLPAMSKPTLVDSRDKILDTFEKISKESLIALNNILKKDDLFKTITPLINVNGNKSKLEIGSQENIRVDNPFIIKRNIDGIQSDLGFLKIRKVGNNLKSLPLEERELSSATAIKGTFENGDLAFEHPWTGIFGVLQTGIDTSSFELDDKDIEGGSLKFGTIGIKADLGYLFNSSILSEIWLGFNFGYGVTDDINLESVNYSENSEDITNSKTLIFNLDLAKRLYLGYSIYSEFGIGGSYKISTFDYNSDENEFTITTLLADPFIKLGYNISPDFEFFGKIGYSIPITTDYNTDDNRKIQALETMDIETTSSINLLIGIAIHTNFTGIFTY